MPKYNGRDQEMPRRRDREQETNKDRRPKVRRLKDKNTHDKTAESRARGPYQGRQNSQRQEINMKRHRKTPGRKTEIKAPRQHYRLGTRRQQDSGRDKKTWTVDTIL
jgi:hypothetical protein